MAQAKTLTEGEIQKLLDHIATKPNARRNRVMFLVKHGHAGVVFLNARLQGELDTYIRGKPWFDPQQSLFTTQARPRKGFTANTMTQTFYYLYRGAGIQGGSSHSGRRTFITTLANKGVSVRLLASLVVQPTLYNSWQHDIALAKMRDSNDCDLYEGTTRKRGQSADGKSTIEASCLDTFLSRRPHN
ncbi:MAG: site-specific integrase [Betaproteobacteria bacterium]|nr:site-specific integrase [Betaproteobacteria bacterium]